MERIAEEAMVTFVIQKCFMAHRTGFVPVAESSILIACCGTHRSDPHQAVMFCVNEVKARLPVWKKVIPLQALVSQEEANNNFTDPPSRCDAKDSGQWSTKSEAFWLRSPRHSGTR